MPSIFIFLSVGGMNENQNKFRRNANARLLHPILSNLLSHIYFIQFGSDRHSNPQDAESFDYSKNYSSRFGILFGSVIFIFD